MIPASSSTAMAGFSLVGVTVRYGLATVLDNVSFTVAPGQVVAFVGENGAGKSTTAKCLAGWIRPSEGVVVVDGLPFTFIRPSDAEALGIAIIPQELDLFPDLTVYENVNAGLKWPRRRGLFDRRALRRRASTALEQLGIDIDPVARVGSLSPAEQKLIQIARAIVRDARLLIMDEPTAALTEAESDRMFRIVHALKAQGRSVVHISHRLDEVFAHCDRLIVLRDGVMVADRAVADTTPDALISLMVGRQVDRIYRRRRDAVVGAPLLTVDGLSRRGHFRDVSFELRRGEIVGMAGLLGAGRTAVAHALFGLAPARAGEIRVDERVVRIESVPDAIAHGIAYLPEERRAQGLHMDFSVAWNLSFGDLDRLLSAGMIDQRAETRLAGTQIERFGVRTADAELAVGLLSGGNQQKVLLAKVLARGPHIIILDEPTRGVDVGAKAEIYSMIEDLAEAGKAVLLISSELEEIVTLSDRVVAMFEGRVEAVLPRDEITAEAIGAATAGRARQCAA